MDGKHLLAGNACRNQTNDGLPCGDLYTVAPAKTLHGLTAAGAD